MPCSNDPLERFVVTFRKVQGDFNPVLDGFGTGVTPMKSITAVSGLGEGTREGVKLIEQDKEFEVPGERRTIPALTLQQRINKNDLEYQFFNIWWRNRQDHLFDIQVFLTDRAWCVKEALIYYGCTLKDRVINDKALDQPNIGSATMVFLPYDVEKMSSSELLGSFLTGNL